MPKFNPDDYEPVRARVNRFYQDHPEGRILTDLLETVGAIGATRWTVRARIWRSAEGEGLPDASGLAMEVDGGKAANSTSALENCETSAIGRALANLGYSGDLKASREEMEKVNREERRQALQAWGQKLQGLENAGDHAGLRAMMDEAQAAGDRDRFGMAQNVENRLKAAESQRRDDLAAFREKVDQQDEETLRKGAAYYRNDQEKLAMCEDALKRRFGVEIQEGELVTA